jgi:hypothetical protein
MRLISHFSLALRPLARLLRSNQITSMSQKSKL